MKLQPPCVALPTYITAWTDTSKKRHSMFLQFRVLKVKTEFFFSIHVFETFLHKLSDTKINLNKYMKIIFPTDSSFS